MGEKRLAEERAASEAAAAAAEEARLAEEAAAAEAEAAAKAEAEVTDSLYPELPAVPAADPVRDQLAQQLVSMGFDQIAAINAIEAANGDLDAALNMILSAPEPEPEPAEMWNEEWDLLLDELKEMGFEDETANREMISEHQGNLKDAVKQLVDRERKSRAASA